ncbi:GrpB family protein [Paenibacillus sp. JNUCC31]|uniref:GrpB family protein n=1 Tax=Paenibacillus sp. JNUCC-31 TaxID=2777983 RepID=UPI00177CEEF7|nr:GrpB family protein [Paenibacillus sp. JNUCC-31]QOS80635.1 GrpB family protein [Paenibacillus sp. JNUCC-31]
MEDQWRIAAYDPAWRHMFFEIGMQLREAMGEKAVRIDHVGSTSIVGMDAKPIIDIQISVSNYENLLNYKQEIEAVGFIFREDNPDRTKRYFREVPGSRRTHVHVRQAGSFSEQMNLLFRDYLREHPEDRLKYAEEKHRLMALYKDQRPKYVEGKGPMVWSILEKAHLWSQEIGWLPEKSDA